MNWLLLQNSLLVATSATVVSLLLGAAVAVTCLCAARRLRWLLLGVAAVAFALPPFLVTNCWLELFGLNGSLRGWIPASILSLGGTVLILSLLHWPLTTGLLVAAWSRTDRVVVESDPLLRGGALFRWILWPAAKPALRVAAAATFVLTLNQFSVPALLQVKVLPAQMWVGFNTTFNYTEALQAAGPMILVALAVIVFLSKTRLGSDARWSWRGLLIHVDLWRSRIGGPMRRVAAVIALLTIGFSVALPLGQLALDGRAWAELVPALQAGQGAITTSLLLAGTTALAIVAIGLALSLRGLAHSWTGKASPRSGDEKVGQRILPADGSANSDSERPRLTRASVDGKTLVSTGQAGSLPYLAWLLFLIPGVVLGLALIWLLNRPLTGWFYGSLGVVVLGWTMRYLAPVWTALKLGAAQLDRAPLEAVQLAGGTRWQQFRLAVWPQLAPVAAVVWYLAFLFCLWDVETLVLIVPPGGETLSLRIFNLLHYGHSGQISALCLILLGIAVLPLVMGWGWRMALRLTTRNVQPTTCLALLIGVSFLTSCTPKQEGRIALDSKLFSHVEVIGTRGGAPGQFNKPRAVCVDRDENIYAVDMTGRVQKFAPDGRFLLYWQMPETDLGKAKGMVRDHDGNVVVIEPHYSRVNHYSTNGTLLGQWGLHGTNAGQLAFPRGVAVNSRGEMFLTEYGQTERIQRFSWRGTNFVTGWGKAGDKPGEFDRVEGLGIGPDDLVYCADSCNHRIQVFTADGKLVRVFGKPGSGVGELSYPYDVRVDKAGNVFVCEFGNSRIQVFDKNGVSVEIIGGVGGAPGRFNNPWSICLDSHGNLYVADSLNHRLQKLVRKTNVATARRPGTWVATLLARPGVSSTKSTKEHEEETAGRAKAPAEPPKNLLLKEGFLAGSRSPSEVPPSPAWKDVRTEAARREPSPYQFN